MAKEYSVVTKIKADISNFSANMKKAREQSDTFNSKLKNGLQKTSGTMKKAGSAMSKYVTAPLMAIGGVAFASANDIDKAYKNIITGTGATGKALEGLKNDFGEVFKSVPNSADEVSNALATINTLTGATGSNLQDLTQNVLEASNALGEDGVANSEAFGKAMNQWQIPAEDGAQQLDHLFKLTQDYGVGLGSVSQKLTAYGATLDNAGFSMSESAHLMASLEASGISVSRVMPGLNSAFRNWADEGKNSRNEFEKTIITMQNAETETEALAIATETFGAEGAQRLTQGVRNGSIALDELGLKMGESSGAISDNTEKTQSFGDKLGILKNKAQEGLQPVGEKLLQLAEEWLPKVIDAVEKVTNWFSNLSPKIQGLIPIIALVVAGIGPFLMVVSSAVGLIASLTTVAGALGIGLLPLVGIIAGVIAIFAGLVTAGIAIYKNWDTIKAKTIEIWNAITSFFVTMFEKVKGIFNNVLNWIDQKTGGKFKAVTDTIREYMEVISNNLKIAWDFVKTTFKNALNFVKSLVTGDFQGMKNAIGSQMNNIKNAISKIWNNVSNFFKSATSRIVGAVKDRFNNLKSGISGTFKLISSIISNIWNGVRSFFVNIVSNIVNSVKSRFNNLRSNISSIFNSIKNRISSIWNSVRSAINSRISSIVSGAKSRFNSMRSSISSTFNSIRSKASSIFNRVRSAITSPINSAVSKVRSSVNKIKGFFRGMRLKIPSIKLPRLPRPRITGSFSLTPPRVPKISWNAKGGIFKKATLFNTANAGLQGVGEAGSEAIIPLKDSVLGKIGAMIAKTMDFNFVGAIENLTNSFNPRMLANAVTSGVNVPIVPASNINETNNNNEDVTINNEYTFNVDGDMSDQDMKKMAKYVAREQVKGLKKKGK